MSAAWTTVELDTLRNYYASHTGADFSIPELLSKLNRSYAACALKASRLGLSNTRSEVRPFGEARCAQMRNHMLRRVQLSGKTPYEWAAPMINRNKLTGNPFKGKSHSLETKAAFSEQRKEWIRSHGHTRGMLGKHHSNEVKDLLSAANLGRIVPREQVMRSVKTRARNGTLFRPRTHVSWKSGWVEVGGKRFYARSRWEANYGRYLAFLVKAGELRDREHEPETFWFEGIKRGCVSYLPDFRVTCNSGAVEYHEVKGWMDARSITKIKRMAKYYPHVKLNVIDASRYRVLSRQLRSIVHGWET